MQHALLFDLDGTLSDTHGLARATWLEVLRPFAIDVDFQFYQSQIRGRCQIEVIDALLPHLGADQRAAICDRERRSYQDRTRRAAPLPGLTPFMDAARARNFRIALVTNAPRADAFMSLEPLGLQNAFEAMVFSDEVEASKPDPAPYNAALRALDMAPEYAIAFEDSTRGVTAARADGIPVIALVTTHHPDELRAAGASLVIGDFADPILQDVLDDPSMLRHRQVEGRRGSRL